MLLMLNKFSLSASFIAISVILTTIVVATIVGNLFVILAILIDKNLQTNANQLVLSLAVADLMVACLVMPLGAYNDIYQGWYLSKEVCEFWTSADVLCCTASILNLLAIALDRYWAVTNVDYIYKRTRRRVNMMILCAWTVGAIVSLAPIFGWKDPDFASRVLIEHKCMVSQDVAYQIFATISTFYAPLVLLLALYWRIFQVARKRIRRKPGQQQQHRSQTKQVVSKRHCGNIDTRKLQLVGDQTPLSLLSATVTNSSNTNNNNKAFSFERGQLKGEGEGEGKGEEEKKGDRQREKQEQLADDTVKKRRNREETHDKPQNESESLSSQSCCKSLSNVVARNSETINSDSNSQTILKVNRKASVAGSANKSSCAKTIGAAICAPGLVVRHNKFKKAKVGPKEEDGGEESNTSGYIENDTQSGSEPGKQYDKVQSNLVDSSKTITLERSEIVGSWSESASMLKEKRGFESRNQLKLSLMEDYDKLSRENLETTFPIPTQQVSGNSALRDAPLAFENSSAIIVFKTSLDQSRTLASSEFRLQQQKHDEASIEDEDEDEDEDEEGERKDKGNGEEKEILIHCKKRAKVVRGRKVFQEEENNNLIPSNDFKKREEALKRGEGKNGAGIRNRNRLPALDNLDTLPTSIPLSLPSSGSAQTNLHREERGKSSISCTRRAPLADHKCFKLNKLGIGTRDSPERTFGSLELAKGGQPLSYSASERPEKMDDNKNNELEERETSKSLCKNHHQIGEPENVRQRGLCCGENSGQSIMDEGGNGDAYGAQSGANLNVVREQGDWKRRMNGQLLFPEELQSGRCKQQVVAGRHKRAATTMADVNNNNSNCFCCCRCDTCLAVTSAAQTYCADCDYESDACLHRAGKSTATAATTTTTIGAAFSGAHRKRAQINHKINCRPYLEDDRLEESSGCWCSRRLGVQQDEEDDDDYDDGLGAESENKRDKKVVSAIQCQGVVSSGSTLPSADKSGPCKVPDLMVRQRRQRHLSWASSREKEQTKKSGLKTDWPYKKGPSTSIAGRRAEEELQLGGVDKSSTTTVSDCSRHQKQVMLLNNATCTETKLGSSCSTASSTTSSSPTTSNSSHHQESATKKPPTPRETTATSTPSNCSLEYMIEPVDADGRTGIRCRRGRCSCFLEFNLDSVEHDLEDGTAPSNGAINTREGDGEDGDYDIQDGDEEVEVEVEEEEEEYDEDELSLSASFPPPIELCATPRPNKTVHRNPAERDATKTKPVPVEATALRQASTYQQVPLHTALGESRLNVEPKTETTELNLNLNLNLKRHSTKSCTHSADDKSSLSLLVSSSNLQQRQPVNATNNSTSTSCTRGTTNAVVLQQQRPQNRLRDYQQISSNNRHLLRQNCPQNFYTKTTSSYETTAANNNIISAKRQRFTTSTTLDLKKKFRTMGQLVSFVQTSRSFYSTTTSGASSSNQSSQSSAGSSHFFNNNNNNNKPSSLDLEQQQPQATNNIRRSKKSGASFCEQVSFRLKRKCNLSFGGTFSGGLDRGVTSPLPSVSASVTSANMEGGSSTTANRSESRVITASYNNDPTTINIAATNTTTNTESQKVINTTNIKSSTINNGNTNDSSNIQQTAKTVVPKQQQQQQQQIASKRSRENMDIRREKKAAKTLAIITGVFVCCWLPFFLNAIIMPICGPSCTPNDLILSVLLWLGYLNSLLNPIIYTIFSPDFRRAFRRLLCWPELVRLTGKGSTFKTTSGKA